MRAPWKKALAVMMIACFLFSSVTTMAAEAVADDYTADEVMTDETDFGSDYMGGGTNHIR